MNHGVAILRRDWDIFCAGDMFPISCWLPEWDDSKATIWTLGQRGCTVAMLGWEDYEEFKELFEVHLYKDVNCGWVAEMDAKGCRFYEVDVEARRRALNADVS